MSYSYLKQLKNFKCIKSVFKWWKTSDFILSLCYSPINLHTMFTLRYRKSRDNLSSSDVKLFSRTTQTTREYGELFRLVFFYDPRWILWIIRKTKLLTFLFSKSYIYLSSKYPSFRSWQINTLLLSWNRGSIPLRSSQDLRSNLSGDASQSRRSGKLLNAWLTIKFIGGIVIFKHE